jgi:hypothetical protein
MWRRLFAVVLVAGLAVGGLLAADGEVVKYSDGKLVLKVEGKERTIEFKKGRPHLHDADGKHLKMKDFTKHLKKGVILEIEEEDGKVVELTIKKKKDKKDK